MNTPLSDELPDEHLAYVDVDGTRTRYYEAGEGPPLVLVHGGHFGSNFALQSWSLNLPGLAEQFHVYAFDKLGQGFTDNPPDDDYTFEAAVDHARRFVETMDLESVHLVGHSRGGLLVAALALDHPELVRTVTIVDSNSLAPVAAEEGHSFYVALEEQIPPGPPTLESVRVEPEANSFGTAHVTEAFLTRKLEINRLEKTQRANARMDEVYKTTFEPSVDRVKNECLERLERDGLTVPTLLVWGVDDPSAKFEWGIELYEILCSETDDAQFHGLNRAGHYSFREQPEAFDRLVGAFCLREW